MSHQHDNSSSLSRVDRLDEFLSRIPEGDFIDGLLALARSVGTSATPDTHGNFIVRVPISDTLLVGSARHPCELSLSLSKSSHCEYPLAVDVVRRHVESRKNAYIVQELYFDDTNTSQIALATSKPRSGLLHG